MKANEDPLILRLLVILLTLLVIPTSAKASKNPYSFPEVITVRVTGNPVCVENARYVLTDVPFKDYVKGVLVNEWGPDWDEESLKAGAVAVKMYAFHTVEHAGSWIPTTIFWKGTWQDSRILPNGKWIDAHVYDCDWDMVYNPAIRSEITDAAVDETWDYILVDENGDIIKTFFNAWYGGCIEQGEENCMGQWNSLRDAENGMGWKDILEKYYDADLICPNCPDNFSVMPTIRKPAFDLDENYTMYQLKLFR